MAERPRKILICSCEDTIPLDGARVERACRGAEVLRGRQLCRAELDRVREAAASGQPLAIACTQEAPLFAEIGDAAMSFVNIRETAGWSKDAKAAGPKIAALIAAAGEAMPDVPVVTLTSEGSALIYGQDERAIEAARLLRDHLAVTVLISKDDATLPLSITEFPLHKGTIRGAIAPNGDHVAIDAQICAGCGQCAAACPTGAAGYALPPADALLRKLRVLLATYIDCGGEQPVLLFHDDDHGRPLIEALARYGDGRRANVRAVDGHE